MTASRTAVMLPALALFATCAAAQDVNALVTRLEDRDAVTRATAACQLDRLGSRAAPAIPVLIAMLSDATGVGRDVCGDWRGWRPRSGDTSETTPGERAAAALASIGSTAFGPLLAAARGPHWVARKNAVWALGALDDERAKGVLMSALRDAEAPVRRNAAWALGAIDTAEAVQALMAALRDSDEKVREQAAWALGAIGSPVGVDGLMGALKSDADAEVRSQAAWALGAIGDGRAAGALAAALKDASAEVRRQAAWALGTVSR